MSAHQNNPLIGYRNQIDTIDTKILQLFLQRMQVVEQVALYKQKEQLPIFQTTREQEILQKRTMAAPIEVQPYVKSLFLALMQTSKEFQQQIINSTSSQHDKPKP